MGWVQWLRARVRVRVTLQSCTAVTLAPSRPRSGRFFCDFSKSAVTTPSENEICHCKRIKTNTFLQMIEISISRNLKRAPTGPQMIHGYRIRLLNESVELYTGVTQRATRGDAARSPRAPRHAAQLRLGALRRVQRGRRWACGTEAPSTRRPESR